MTRHNRVWGIVVLLLLVLCGCQKEAPRTVYQGYVEGDFVYVGGKIGGHMEDLRVTRGTRVTVGQTLYVLEHGYQDQAVRLAEADVRQAEDTLRDKQKGLRPEEIAQLDAALRQAEASRTLSQLEFDRRVKLFADATIAKEELDNARTSQTRDRQQVRELEAKLATGHLPSRYDQILAAQAAVEAARARLDQARWDLGQMTQRAGVAGLVYDVLHFTGEWLGAGSPAVVLLPPQNVKVRFFVPQAVASGLSPGRAIQVSCDGLAKPVAAVISYVSASVEYTPPVIYSQGFRDKLVIMVEARFAPDVAAGMHPGQPVDVFFGSGDAGGAS